MSWYGQDINNLFTSNREVRQVTINLIVTNMKTEEDRQKVGNALQNLNGIINLTILPRNRRLVITYNLDQINLENICHHISQLGYNYVKKA
ncbi:MAG: hypothetical protein PWP31_1189 [Clostridia bacterium]|nr:hypothetical protein [Clostridia bacterium]